MRAGSAIRMMSGARNALRLPPPQAAFEPAIRCRSKTAAEESAPAMTVISTGRNCVSLAAMMALISTAYRFPLPVALRDDQNPVHHGDSEQRDKPIAAETLKGNCVTDITMPPTIAMGLR